MIRVTVIVAINVKRRKKYFKKMYQYAHFTIHCWSVAYDELQEDTGNTLVSCCRLVCDKSKEGKILPKRLKINLFCNPFFS